MKYLLLLPILLLPHWSFAQFESEPNDTYGSADPITFNTTWQGYINTTTDDDVYAIPVPEPGIIKLQVFNVPENIDLASYIYHPNQSTQIRKRTGISNGQAYTLEVSTCETGIHYLILADEHPGTSTGQANTTMAYSFIVGFTPFSALDECECENSSFSNSCEVDFGVTNQALIAPYFDDAPTTNDVDYYKFFVPEPGMLKLQVFNVPGNIDLRAYMYHPDQSTEIQNITSVANGVAYILEVSTCETGYHYLFLADEHPGTSTGQFNAEEQYSFIIDFTPFSQVDPCECENSSLNNSCEIDFGVTYQALLAPWFDDGPTVNDVDYYKFYVDEPGMIKLELFNVPGNIDMRSYIYLPDQNDIIRQRVNVSNGASYTLEVSACETGYHYLLMLDEHPGENNGSFNSEDPYNFSVDFIPFSEVDMCECNNDSFNDACSIVLGDTIQAVIAPMFNDTPVDNDGDYFKFSIIEPGVVQFELLNVPGNLDIVAYLYRPDQSTEIARRTGVANGQSYAIDFSACELGDYYLYLGDEHPGSSTGSFNSEETYEFVANFTPFSQADACECNGSFSDACMLDLCTPIQATIAPSFDESPNERDLDYYQVYLEENEQVDLMITDVPSDLELCVYIYDPARNTIDVHGLSEGEGLATSFTTETAGTHFILIRECGNAYTINEQYTLSVGCTLINDTEELIDPFQLQLSPNPFREAFFISKGGGFFNSDHLRIRLLDLKGHEFPVSMAIGADRIQCTPPDLPEGVYLIYLTADDFTWAGKLIKG